MSYEPKRLYRTTNEKYIAGVAGGLGEYFDIDPTFVRLAFVILAFFSGLGLLAYIVLAIVTPTKKELEMKNRIRKETEVNNESYNPFGESEVEEVNKENIAKEENDAIHLEPEELEVNEQEEVDED